MFYFEDIVKLYSESLQNKYFQIEILKNFFLMSEVKTQNLAQCLSDHKNWFLVPQSFSFSNNPHKPHIKRKVFLRPFQNSFYFFNWLIRSHELPINVKVGVALDRGF